MKKVNRQIFLLYIKMIDTNTYYQRNRKRILKRVKEYYEKNNDRIRNQARNKHRELSGEKKEIKREYGRNTKKEEYQKNYREAKKSKYYLLNKIQLFFFMQYKNGRKSLKFW